MEHNEQDLHQLIQIREDIHQELEKIPPLVLQFQEMTNRFVEHFKAFETLSQNAQNQLKVTIKNASFEIAELASEEFIQQAEGQVRHILSNLDQSVIETKEVLGKVSKSNILKVTFLMTLLILLSLSIGFILGGYYYEKRTYELSREFLKRHK